MTNTHVRTSSQFLHRLRLLHWLMAVMFLLMFISGPLMARLPRDFPFLFDLYDFHKTIGVLTIIILLLRIYYLRAFWQQQQQQANFNHLWRKTAILYLGLYGLMLLIPISGYFFSNSAGFDVVIFGTGFALPRLFPENAALGKLADSIHLWLGYFFLATIGLHLATQWRYIRGKVSAWFR